MTAFEPHIGDADTAEGQARRAEEAFIDQLEEDDESMTETYNPDEELWSTEELADELPELPTPEEAELGELCQYPEVDLTEEPPTFEEL